MKLRLGAELIDPSTTRFVVWAPSSPEVSVRLVDGGATFELAAVGHGYHSGVAPCGAGALYRYVLSDGREFADPASRSQPEGVQGPSAVVDLAHRWSDDGWCPRPLWDQVIYELHVGTFTDEGTFDSATADLERLAALGISAVEVMPVGQFPGRRNWGYDGVFPFAVQNSYGGPAGLQRFVDACHGRGLAVILDVVYNHLGPEGDVLVNYGPYFTDVYQTPWGQAVNLDGAGSDEVREYFIQNAEQWFDAFHIDCLRLDAVHELIDRSATPFLNDLSRRTAGLSALRGRSYRLIAESADNDPRLMAPYETGGAGMDAQWNDDFHHALHAAVTGERFGYYVDFASPEALARAMDSGFVYQGEHSFFRDRRHGAPSGALEPERFVVFAQNHDHVGNRAGAERLVTLLDPQKARLVMAAVLLAPGIPLLFMGEEYGETAPFPYFVDHSDPALVQAVREGRAREFAEVAQKGQLFDPGEEATFVAARLDRSLCARPENREFAEFTGRLISLRRGHALLRRSRRHQVRAEATGGVVSLVRWDDEEAVAVYFNLTGQNRDVPLPSVGFAAVDAGCWSDLLSEPKSGLPPGDTFPLGGWEFAVYGLRSGHGPATEVAE